MRALPLSLFTFFAVSSTALADISVEGDLARDLQVQPGQSYKLLVTLRNNGVKETTARVSLEDVRVNPNETTYLPPGTLEKSNAAWINLGAKAVKVPANGTRVLELFVNVPKSATAGTFWSTLIVQNDATRSSQGGVVANLRYAVQLITTVPGEQPKVRITSPRLGGANGKVHFGVDVFNDGLTATRPFYVLEVYDGQGRVVARTENNKKRLYPGGGVRVDFQFDKLPIGKYTFLVFANDGSANVSGTRYNVNVKD